MLLAVLAFGALSWALGQSSVFPALPEIGRALDAGPDATAWTISSYMASAAICTPLSGRLGDQLGRREVLFACMAAGTAGAVVCAVADSLELLVVGRVLQGVGGGVFPLSFAIVHDELPPLARAKAIGTISALLGVGSGIGLPIGGFLAEHASYEWVFWASAILGVVACVLIRVAVRPSEPQPRTRLDVRGAVVLAVGLGLLLVGVSRTNAWGWDSAPVLTLLATGALVLVGWWWLQRVTPEPLADVESLADPPVLLANAVTLLIGFGVFGSFLLLPLLGQVPLGLDAATAGLLLMPGALLMLVVGPVAGAVSARHGSKAPLVAGGVLAAGGLALGAAVAPSAAGLALLGALVYSGIGLSFAAMPNLILEAVPSERSGEAAGFNALVRLVGAALGSQVIAAILAGSPGAAGFDRAFLLGALVTAAGTLLALVVPPPARIGVGDVDQRAALAVPALDPVAPRLPPS